MLRTEHMHYTKYIQKEKSPRFGLFDLAYAFRGALGGGVYAVHPKACSFKAYRNSEARPFSLNAASPLRGDIKIMCQSVGSLSPSSSSIHVPITCGPHFNLLFAGNANRHYTLGRRSTI